MFRLTGFRLINSKYGFYANNNFSYILLIHVIGATIIVGSSTLSPKSRYVTGENGFMTEENGILRLNTVILRER